MASESFKREAMQTSDARTEYVGAFLEEERRLMLVAVDPSEPWDAFRKLRRAMRRTKQPESAQLAFYESSAPIERNADVISLRSRRRAG